MKTHETEIELIRQQRGKWSDKGVPHRGWACVDIEDLGEDRIVCEMCESQEIRYSHYMTHVKYEDVLKVGCICAGHMEEDLNSAKSRDKHMRNRSGKRKKWLERVWKKSAKGNDFIKSDGYVVSIFEKENGWGAMIAKEDSKYKKYSRLYYETSDRAKLAAFDVITRLLARKSV